MLCFLLVQPSVYREATVSESPRAALDRSNFMQRRAREENDLVLLRHDRLVAPRAKRVAALLPCIMQPQLSALEPARFAMEKVHERHPSRCDPLLRVITMGMEKVSVIAGGDLHLRPRNGKLLDPKFFQHLWQHRPDSIQDHRLVRSQL